jgi:hypothetical protein
VKKYLLIAMLCLLSVLLVHQALAAKRTSHKEYADMPLKECNECHKEQGITLTHENDWAGKHHQDNDWMGEHRALAGKAGNNCTDCHDQSFCLECHAGGGVDVDLTDMNSRRNYIPKSHRSNWLEIHPLKAQDNPQTCTRCHVQKYCADCHAKFKPTDLQFQSHRRQFRDIKLSDVGPNHAIFEQNGVINTAVCQTCHAGGVVPTHTWSSDHAREARRNLQTCQACHSDGDVCLTCHSARSGLKVNPHPRNWNSVKENFRDRSGGRSCIRCHNDQ